MPVSNVATTMVGAVTVIVHVMALPKHAPVQLINVAPTAGTAVSVTTVFLE